MEELRHIYSHTFYDISNTHKYNFLIPEEEELPDVITGTYTNDYDITRIDNIIRKKLKREQNNLPEYYKKLQIEKEKFKKPQIKIEKEITKENIKNLENKIDDITYLKSLNEYIQKSQKVLSEYKSMKKKIHLIIMDDNETIESEKDEEFNLKIKRIEKYIEIAEEYIPIRLVRKVEFKPSCCPNCGYCLKNVFLDENGCKTCPECDCEYYAMIKSSNKEVTKSSNYTNESEGLENFMRTFMRYQGFQSDKPSPTLYEELDNYFELSGIPKSEEIKKLPCDEHGRKPGTNHKMLLNALSTIKKSEFYEDVNLIGHEYWGWELPNLMHLKDKIASDYIKTQRVYFQIPPEERQRESSLGTQFRLWKHLQLLGHPCTMNEFKIAENQESLRKHDKLWKMMCEGTKDPTIRYI